MTTFAKILAGGLIATLGDPLVRVWEWLTDDPACEWANRTAGGDEG